MYGNVGKYSTISTLSIYWAEPSKTCSMNLTVIRHLGIV